MVILGVDLGRARTGLSICDPAESLAVPLSVIHERNEVRLIEQIAETARTRQVQEIALGLLCKERNR